MLEAGDVIFLPPRFGNAKKGVLVRKELDGQWLIQIGTSSYQYLPEVELRPMKRSSRCWNCGALLNDSHNSERSAGQDGSDKCSTCGACACRRSDDK